MKQVSHFFALTVACLLGLTNSASAQNPITWDASVQMYPGTTEQIFVNTIGVLVYATNLDQRRDGTTTVTVNGVDFVETNLANLGSVVSPIGVAMSTTVPNDTGASYLGGSFTSDGDIFNLIATGIFNPGDVTFSGLTPGRTYQIQAFVNDARNGRHREFVCLFSDGVNPLTLANASACRLSNLSPNGPNRACLIGDSFYVGTARAGGLLEQGVSFPLDYSRSVSGSTVSQFPTAIAAKGAMPDLVILVRGINDIAGGTSTTVADFMAKLDSATNAAFAAGATRVMVGTVPPFASVLSGGYSAEKQQLILDVNDAIRNQPNPAIGVCDIHGILVDPATGFLADQYKRSTNDIHPNMTGSQAIADGLAAIIDSDTTVYGEPSGDSITGTFVAGADGTQFFSINGSVDGGATFENGGRAQINAIQLRDITDVVLLGDVDLNGEVNFFDVFPFITILAEGTFQAEADCDESGAVEFSDISAFIAILSGT